MDVTQIPIKINQTSQSDGKSNINSQAEVQTNSFGQILQNLQALASLSEQDSKSLVENGTEPLKSESKDPLKLSDEDQENLDSVLSELFVVLQRFQQLPEILQHPSVNNSLFAEPQTSVESGGLTSLQPIPGDVPNELNQWSSREVVFQQLSTVDVNQLMKGTAKLIENSKEQEIFIPEEVLDEIEIKLQKILDEIKPANEPNDPLQLDSKLIKNDYVSQLNVELNPEIKKSINVLDNINTKLHMILDVIKPINKSDDKPITVSPLDKNVISHFSKTQISLNKNLVGFTSIHEMEKLNDKQGQLVAVGDQKNPNVVNFSSIQEMNKLNDNQGQQVGAGDQKNPNVMFTANQQQIETKGLIPSKSEPSPQYINVSNLVPEVSGWIGRSMRVTNGQSGSIETKFSLYPEHFGHLEIKITSHQGQVSAQIVTNTMMAKEALEGRIEHLSDALKQHGILVQKLDIVHQPAVTIDLNQDSTSFSQGGSSSSHDQRNFQLAEEKTKKQKASDLPEIEKEPLPISYGATAHRTESRIDFTA